MKIVPIFSAKRWLDWSSSSHRKLQVNFDKAENVEIENREKGRNFERLQKYFHLQTVWTG